MGSNAKLRRDINSPDFFYLVTAYSVGMGCCRPNVLPQPEYSGHKVTQSSDQRPVSSRYRDITCCWTDEFNAYENIAGIIGIVSILFDVMKVTK